MIRWMLARMEKSPSAVFYEKELVERFPADFEWAKRERLLSRVQTQLEGGSYTLHGRTLSVVCDEGKIEAFDDEDPEFDAIELGPDDLARWRLDLQTFAERFQEANGLRGAPGTLHDRLFFLGEGERNGAWASFVLGLLHERRSAQTILLSLSNRLPGTGNRIAVVCPTFAAAPSDLRHLESLNVHVVRLGTHDDLFLLNDPAIWEAIRPGQLSTEPSGNTFRREGEYWTIGDPEHVCRLRDTRGVRYIAHLLRYPDREFHVLDLVALVEGTQQPEAGGYPGMTTDQLAEDGLTLSGGEGRERLLDAQARTEYQTAIRELDEEINEAERNNDVERAANLKEQRDLILEQLRAAFGLGGRERRTGSPAERARVNVTKQVGKAVERIEKEHEALGRHLRNAIRTGAFCSYRPETPTDWVL